MEAKFYSADEVIRMMDHAKQTGMRFIKIAGFEATWDTGTNRPPLSAVPTPAPALTPRPSDAQTLSAEHVISFGKFKGKTVRQVDAKELEEYCRHFVESLPPADMSPALRAMIDNAEMYQYGKISWRPLEQRN